MRACSRLHLLSQEGRALFKKIVKSPTEKRDVIINDLRKLERMAGLKYTLLALYQQQVNSGFVLGEILRAKGREKKFFDSATNVEFRLQWNPIRELRKNHVLLIKRGVIKDVAKAELINEGCYLCKPNIDKQNPGEILLELELGNEKLYAGANFAPITNNHFTVMSAVHRPQQYRRKMLEFLTGFVAKTDGYFRALFNGSAGASIGWHEHFQVTPAAFPIERLKIRKHEVIYQSNGTRVTKPMYYIPVWLVEGTEELKIESMCDEVITKWHSLNEEYHTENIITAKCKKLYRIFIILRDRRKLICTQKKGEMGVFETGGFIVLSYEPKEGLSGVDEKNIYENANLELIKNMLCEIAPDKQAVLQHSKDVKQKIFSYE